MGSWRFITLVTVISLFILEKLIVLSFQSCSPGEMNGNRELAVMSV